MLILEEEYVRVETITGKIVFGYLDVFEEVSDAGTIITPRREEITPVRNSMYFYNVDPLTSEVQKGLDGFYYKDVKSLRTVPALPIDEDFEIDSLEQFFNKRLVNSYVWTRPGSPTVPMDEDVHFSKVFRSAFDRFLCANGAALLARSLDSASPFRKSDLTQLGLDFTRQHYRFVKAGAIRKQTVPTLDFLQRLLAITMKNRTTDADWTKPEIGPWIGKGIES